MKVVHVDIRKVNNNSKLVAYANVQFSLIEGGDGCMTWDGVKLINGANGYFVAMPSDKVEKEGEEVKWYDRIKFSKDNPEAQALLKHITEEVVKYYNGEAKPAKSSNNDNGFNPDEDIPF